MERSWSWNFRHEIGKNEVGNNEVEKNEVGNNEVEKNEVGKLGPKLNSRC